MLCLCVILIVLGLTSQDSWYYVLQVTIYVTSWPNFISTIILWKVAKSLTPAQVSPRKKNKCSFIKQLVYYVQCTQYFFLIMIDLEEHSDNVLSYRWENLRAWMNSPRSNNKYTNNFRSTFMPKYCYSQWTFSYVPF